MRSKKAIYNVLTNLLLQLISIVYGFIVPKIIISNFGSNVNGLISSITQFLAYITLLESGFGPVVKSILYKPIASKDKNTIAKILKASEKFFKTISYIFIGYIIILSLIYSTLINNDYEFIYTFSLIIIISISTFAEYYFGMTYRLYLQAEQKAYIISLIQIITYILSILLVIILAKVGCSIHSIKLVSGLIFVLRPIMQNIYVKKKYNINLKGIDNNYKIEQKWDGLAQHIAAVIHSNTDITVLTFFTTLAEVSVYSVYYLVVNGVIRLVQVFSSGLDAGFGDMIVKKENANLNKKFSMYEVIYYTLITIIFTCTIILIVPFISIYTKGITDANYIRYKFGYLIVISEFIWAVRLPYSSLTLAAGHFKQTRIGAWVECLSNLLLSIILVKRYGIIGVTIGTIVAMFIRTIEFVYHSNKYILNRNLLISVKKIILIIIETMLIVFISKYLPYLENINYLNWIINAIMVSVVACIFVIPINYIFYKNEFIELVKTLKSIISRKRKYNAKN